MAGKNDEVDKIDVNGDSRVSWKSAVINGKTYGTVAQFTCALTTAD
jgi:hypothetical protein